MPRRRGTAFRRHTPLLLDDCLYALQASIPHLTRSSLNRCLQRHEISRLPHVGGDKPENCKFRTVAIGCFNVDVAEVRTKQGEIHLSVAIDRTSKFAFVELHKLRAPCVVTSSSNSAFVQCLLKCGNTRLRCLPVVAETGLERPTEMRIHDRWAKRRSDITSATSLRP